MKEKPEVSICVIAYDSQSTITETLNSITAQDYPLSKVQLIIADDCSTDDTLAIASNWLKQYSTRFHSVRLLHSKQNKGVSGNCNLAWKNAEGIWIKTIAADDILLPNCIRDNIEYTSNSDIHVVISKMQCFSVDKRGVTHNEGIEDPRQSSRHFFDMSPNRQLERLLISNFITAPSSFIRRSVLQKLGYADERFPLIEDYPLWLKITTNGYTIYFMDKTTVKYRVNDSLSTSTSRFTNIKFNHEELNILRTLIRPHISGLHWCFYYDFVLHCKHKIYIAKLFNNKRHALSRALFVTVSLFSPMYYRAKFVKIKAWASHKRQMLSSHPNHG